MGDHEKQQGDQLPAELGIEVEHNIAHASRAATDPVECLESGHQ